MQTLKPKPYFPIKIQTQTCDSSLHLHIHTDRNREAMKERERRRGNGERSREREIEIRYTQRWKQREAMRPGTRREKQRRERGKTRLLLDFSLPSVPSPDSEHRNRRHTQELRLRIVETATGYFFPLSYIWVFNMTQFLGILVGQVQIQIFAQMFWDFLL